MLDNLWKMMKLYKYHGAGNDFILVDNRKGDLHLGVEDIKLLCDRHLGIGSDGLMLLGLPSDDAISQMSLHGSVEAPATSSVADSQESPRGSVDTLRASSMSDSPTGSNASWNDSLASSLPDLSGKSVTESGPDAHCGSCTETVHIDFTMDFYNPDGSGGMMCGNGARCIVAFAYDLGIRPANGEFYRFLAPDGLHKAWVTESSSAASENHHNDNSEHHETIHCQTQIASRLAVNQKIVRVTMKDVDGARHFDDGSWFLDTGTRHLVVFRQNVEEVDVENEGRQLRWDPTFAPVGTNVNFVDFGGCPRTNLDSNTVANGDSTVAKDIDSIIARDCNSSATRSFNSSTSGSVDSVSARDCDLSETSDADSVATGDCNLSATSDNSSVTAGDVNSLESDIGGQSRNANGNAASIGIIPELNVRTFEKGVEAETLACGTGIVASALAAWLHLAESSHDTDLRAVDRHTNIASSGVKRPSDSSEAALAASASHNSVATSGLPTPASSSDADSATPATSHSAAHPAVTPNSSDSSDTHQTARSAAPVTVTLHSRIATLQVTSTPHPGNRFTDITLCGPAQYVAEIII